jgi:ADP-heptose:LPS heptosyltransferase
LKILAVSLLRLGDIIISMPAIGMLRAKYPGAEIHFLVHRQFSSVETILQGPDRWIYFDRERIQGAIGNPASSLFEAADSLSAFVDGLSAENYDLVLNLTHNRLSGWLLSLIKSKATMGLIFDEMGRAQFSSPWFRQLNFQADSDEENAFHLIDIFLGAVTGLAKVPSDSSQNNKFGPAHDKNGVAPEISWGLRETTDGLIEASQVQSGYGGLIAIQPLTSDIKKNWGLDRFAILAQSLRRRHPEARIVFLCSPSERTSLEEPLKMVLSENVTLAELSLAGIISLMKRTKILITGDTSIKHIAAAMSVQTLEIVIGSSDHRMTGTYAQDAVILKTLEACAPCTHSKSCHRPRQFCAESMPIDAVSMIASELYLGQFLQLPSIAADFSDVVEVLRVSINETGSWYAYSVAAALSESAVAPILDQVVKKISLQESTSINLSTEVGLSDEVNATMRLLRTMYPDVSLTDWRYMFAEFERQLGSIQARMNGMKIGLKILSSNYENQKRMREFVRSLQSLREKTRQHLFLRSYDLAFSSLLEDDISTPFVRLRKIVDIIGQLDRRSQLALKFVRVLESEMTDPIMVEEVL